MSDSTQHLCETIMSHAFLLKWTGIWQFPILVAQNEMSHDICRPYLHTTTTRFMSHNHVAPSHTTKFFVRVDAP